MFKEVPSVSLYRDADLILLNGTSYAAWTTSAPPSSARTIDTPVGFHDRLIGSQIGGSFQAAGTFRIQEMSRQRGG